MTNYTNKAQQQVGEFQNTFGHPAPTEPTVLPLDRVVGRSSWGSGEEIVELIHASSNNDIEFKTAFIGFLQGLRKGYEKQKVKAFPINDEERLIAQADAIADHLYFVLGDAVELGVDIGKVLTIVHEANMSKLFTDENGNKYVKYSPSGKVLKSPEFEAPEEKIKLEILRQIEDAKKVKEAIDIVTSDLDLIGGVSKDIGEQVSNDLKDIEDKVTAKRGRKKKKEVIEDSVGDIGGELNFDDVGDLVD